jgi:hypothetical protein
MDAQVIVSIVSVISAAIIALVGAVFWFGVRMGSLSSKVESMEKNMENIQRDMDQIQGGLFHRGQAELVAKNMGSFHSPFQLGQLGVNAVLPFVEEFIPFYAQIKREQPEITDAKFMWLFEEKFGATILEKICAPEGLSNFGCIVAILDVCKMKEAERV